MNDKIAREALRLIRDCFKAGNYYVEPTHGEKQMKMRGITIADIKNAVKWCQNIERYPNARLSDDAEGWRIYGPPLGPLKKMKRKRNIGVGICLYKNA